MDIHVEDAPRPDEGEEIIIVVTRRRKKRIVIARIEPVGPVTDRDTSKENN